MELNQPALSRNQRRSCRRAFELFQKGDYAGCLEVWTELASFRPTDHRVEYSRLVAQFWTEDRKGVDQFFSRVVTLLKKIGISLKKITAEDVARIRPILLFNLAVLFYHDKQMEKAWSIIEILSEAFVDDKLDKRINLLKVAMLVKQQRFGPALVQIELIESQFRRSEGADEAVVHIQGDDQDVAHIQGDDQDVVHIQGDDQDVVHIQGDDQDVVHIQGDDQDVVHIDNVPPWKPDQELDGTMKIKLQEFKTLCYLRILSLDAAKIEYRILINMSTSPPETDTLDLYLKAYYNYLRGKPDKSLAIMDKISEKSSENFLKTGNNMAMIYYNNIGCCHYARNKPTIAAWFFQKAFEECNKPEYKVRKDLPLYCLSYNKRLEITYNFGMARLLRKEFSEAFDILCRCQAKFSSNPRLWLRIAECCIKLYESSREAGFTCTTTENDFTENPSNTNGTEVCLSNQSRDSDKPKPTLAYALFCIESAIKLFSPEGKTVGNEEGFRVDPSPPITNPQEVRDLHAQILSTGAYIALTLKDHSRAVLLCKELLALRDVPNSFLTLGKNYLGEALFRRGDVQQGLSMLEGTENNTSNNELVTPTEGEDEACGYQHENHGQNITQNPGPSSSNSNTRREELRPTTSSVSRPPEDEQMERSVLTYNQAVALTKLDRYQDAADLIQTWSDNDPTAYRHFPQFLELAIHVNIKLGKKDKVKILMQKYNASKPANPPNT